MSELAGLVPSVYRLARRLTDRAGEAVSVARDALGAVPAGSATSADATATGSDAAARMAAYRELWEALQRSWQRHGHVQQASDEATAEALLHGSLFADEGELDRLLISHLDASPELDVALRRLPDLERFVLLLVDAEDVEREAAAAVLGLDPREVSALLLRARARVFESLMDYVRTREGWAPADGTDCTTEEVQQRGGATLDPGAVPHPPLSALQDALDHRLAGTARLRVDEHLAACACCRRQMHALRWTTLRVAGVAAEHLPPALVRELTSSRS